MRNECGGLVRKCLSTAAGVLLAIIEDVPAGVCSTCGER
jgi:YgiT-type zinc finger domain-containing protein